MNREDAYALVQDAAMQAWDTGNPFRTTLRDQAAAHGQRIDDRRLDEVCRPERYTERLGAVFERLQRLS
jgi:adenylosuccinate lyase